MYDANNMTDFEKKLLTYEIQYAMTKNEQQKNEQVNKQRNKNKSKSGPQVPRCYNCGDELHSTPDCPSKSKGPKCFSCNSFGHMSSSCPNPPADRNVNRKTKNSINVISSREKTYARKNIMINNRPVYALIDSGSDYSVIREDIIQSKSIPFTRETFTETIKGVGGITNLKGKFEADFQFDDDVHHSICHIISKEDINDEAIIGFDVLQHFSVQITTNNVVLKRVNEPNKINHNDEPNAFAELCNIDYIPANEKQMADLSHLSSNTQSQVYELIRNYSPKPEQLCPIEMEIILQDEIPISTKPRRLSPAERTELDKQIKQWLSDDVIRHSYSDYAAQVLFKPKKDGNKRLCVDYRRLNKKIIRDRFPVPNLDEQLDQMQTGTVYTTMDLKNGYHHVPIKENSKKYTAFVTPTGQYEFNRVPFGLSSSPSVFCRFIHIIFRDLIAEGIVATYMDDIIIIANNDEEAIHRLKIVLSQAARYNLNINWKKCEFLKRRVEVFGYEIENKTIRSSESKIKDVNKYPEPKNIKELQRFLGFANYFRKFMENYAMIAKPLTDLTKKDSKFQFGWAETESFRLLRSKIIEKPVLMIYQPGAETQLHTDASKFATAAILMQRSSEDNEFHPVLFMSSRTSKEQEKWFANVSAVQKALNGSHQRAINTTPFQLMFGTTMKGNNLEIMRIIEEEIAKHFDEERNELRAQAKEQIQKIQEENRRTFNKKRKTAKTYNIDDLVAITKTQFSSGAKLKPKNMGPYKVTKIERNDRYGVNKIGINEGPKETTTSADNMTSWPTINWTQPSRENKRTTTIFIEGNIGAGKSTLINSLAKYDFIKIHQEPVDSWQNFNGFNLLDLVYKNPAKYGFMFQSFALLTMANRQTNDLDETKINVLERSIPSSTACFVQALIENGAIEPPFAQVLHEWSEFIQSKLITEPDLIIYLQTDPEQLLNRIKERARKVERNINPQYLRQLHGLHEDYIQVMEKKYTVLRVNANEKLNDEIHNKIVQLIKNAGGVD